MGTEDEWAALSKEVESFAEERDDDNDDNVSVAKLPNASEDGDEEAAVAIDTELDADRFAHDAELESPMSIYSRIRIFASTAKRILAFARILIT